MPITLLTPILLRAAGPVAFVLAAIVAGVLNRPVILVLILALAATMTTLLIRRYGLSPIDQVQAMLGQNAAPVGSMSLRSMGLRFGLGVLGYAFMFGLAALIAALFQETEFEQRLGWPDLCLVLIPAGAALIFGWMSAKAGAAQAEKMMSQMQFAFSAMQPDARTPHAANDDDAFTVDGEVIDPDR